MTSWYPGDGDRGQELLHRGDEAPAARPVRLFAAALALLVLGVVAGDRFGEALPWAGAHATATRLVGGSVSQVVRVDDRHRFRVGLFNPGEQGVRVRVVGLVGRVTPVAGSRPARVAPGGWAHPAFSLPDECSVWALAEVTAVRVRILGAGGGTQDVALARPDTALRAHHDRECAAPTAVTKRALGGLWLLERVEGRWVELAGVGLMRFTRDGRFAFDPEGQLFHERHQGFFGSYRLDGPGLHLVADGGYACRKGYHELWSTTRIDENLLQLDIVRSDRGWCRSPPHERWILRRLLPEKGLPAPAPGVSAPRR